ncbi:uncharacterized protein LOC117218214 isoform X1 [Megalopta genalis]|uniref:uncharacterized protein LOC117218214 isoform X1 n=2 Tax=Megalopta genalis TaxID=115081 RepID=UPI003FD2069C
MLSRISEIDENSPTKSEEGASPSPITDIVHGLMKSSLSSDNCLKRRIKEMGENRQIGGDSVGTRCLSEHGCTGSKGPKRQRLFKNIFKFKNTSGNSIKSSPTGRRLFGMAPRRFSSLEPVSPSVGKENSNIGSNPRRVSPQKTPLGSKRCRYPLEDCDPNSRDNCYEANYTEKMEKPKEGFRFLEPMAVAPRRMSIEYRSPIQSPLRSSPQQLRVMQQTLFRNHSSGYESMDDGFNEIESLEDSQVSNELLSNSISILLRGNIVGIESPEPLCNISSTIKMDTNSPSTPEFPRTNRTGNFRRSLFLQNEKPETRKSLSKVRSCLFGSPNSSPPPTILNSDLEDSPLSQRLTSTTEIMATTTATAEILSLPRRQICYSDELSNNSDLDSPVSGNTFKRPDPPMDDSPMLAKRLRSSNSTVFDGIRHCSIDTPTFSLPLVGISCRRSLSETSATIAIMETTKEATIMDADTDIDIDIDTDTHTAANIEIKTESHALIDSAIHRSITDTDLTGDFSKPLVLPLAVGHHQDLKSISASTLAALVQGEFDDRVRSFKIVDCRYPYEFEAGHIQGALNLYNKDLIEENLLNPLTDIPNIESDTDKRNIVIFHCEFSWKRGPFLSRSLRNLDRQRNKGCYPALHYPEIYLLHGGYEQFYKEQKQLCSPQGYRPMKHPDYETDLKKFRSKSKSWQGEKSRIADYATRTSLKRLGF